MNYEGNDWGYFGFVHVVGLIAYGVFALLALAVVTGLVILLVRFLLIGTKAAQLYVAKNGVAKNDAATTAPSKPAAPAAPESRPTPTASAPEATTPLSPVDAAIAPTPPKTSPATSTSSTTTPLPAAGTTAPKAAAKKPATRTPKTPPTV